MRGARIFFSTRYSQHFFPSLLSPFKRVSISPESFYFPSFVFLSIFLSTITNLLFFSSSSSSFLKRDETKEGMKRSEDPVFE